MQFSLRLNVEMSATKTATQYKQLANRTMLDKECLKANSNFRHLLIDRQSTPHVYSIQFNRPAVKNALNRQAYLELLRAMQSATHDPDIRVIVLSGAGDCFTAGNDLTQLNDFQDHKEYFRNANFVLRNVVKAFLNCHKLVVAMVHGVCMGVGFTLCALCDLVYCTEDAYFQAPFTQLGICPELGSSYLLPLILGRSKATELLLCGGKLQSSEAFTFNFVAQVFANVDEMQRTLLPQLKKHALLPAQSLKISKRLLWLPQRENILQAVDRECKELESLRCAPAHLNALKSFIAIRTDRRTQSKSKL